MVRASEAAVPFLPILGAEIVKHLLALLVLTTSWSSSVFSQVPTGGTQPEVSGKDASRKPDDGKDPNVKRDVSHYHLGKDGLALMGYDPVGYFPEGGGKPIKGSDTITYRYRGVLYRFATNANKETFVAAPAKYEPAYGGYCAYGMAKEDKVEIDPRSFLIENGKLLLFYDGFLADTRKKWLDADGKAKLEPKATRYWKKLHGV